MCFGLCLMSLSDRVGDLWILNEWRHFCFSFFFFSNVYIVNMCALWEYGAGSFTRMVWWGKSQRSWVIWKNWLAWICMATNWKDKYQRPLLSWSHLDFCELLDLHWLMLSCVLNFKIEQLLDIWFPCLWFSRLNNNKLSGPIPKELATLSNLKVL